MFYSQLEGVIFRVGLVSDGLVNVEFLKSPSC